MKNKKEEIKKEKVSSVLIVSTIKFEDIFPDEPIRNVESYLQGIGKKKLIEYASYLGLQEYILDLKKAKTLLAAFFSQPNLEFTNEIYIHIQQLFADGRPFAIAHQISVLRLFQYAYKLPDEITQKNEEAEVSIFKAILVLNTEVLKNYDKDSFGIPKELEGLNPYGIAWFYICMAVPYGEIQNYHSFTDFKCQVIKAIYLSEFLEKNEHLTNLFKSFLVKNDCVTFKEYLSKLLPIIMLKVDDSKNQIGIIWVPQGKQYDESRQLLRNLAYQTDNIFDDDFNYIRDTPFYEMDSESFFIICTSFLVEKVFKGQYYHLDQCLKSMPIEEGKKLLKHLKTGDLRSYYCNNFSEQYLVYELLKSIYGTKYKQLTGEQCKEYMEGGPDYYYRKNNDLFLFESKDIRISSIDRLSSNYDIYRDFLISRLYFKQQKSGKVDSKAIMQLINNIRTALSSKFKFDQSYDPKKLRIYPIVILHDRMFDSPGFNYIINEWFIDELEKLKSEGIDISNVRHLTLIDIDTFILYQEDLNDRKYKLEDLIDSYHKTIKYNPAKKYKDSNDNKQAYELQFISFQSYLLTFQRPTNRAKFLLSKGIKLEIVD